MKDQDSLKFVVLVAYVQPEFEELQRRFSDCVHSEYEGRCFNPIEYCKGVSKVDRIVSFEYVHMDRYASSDEVLAEMDREGLRPALYEELLGFAEEYPDEQRKHPIVALGSEMRIAGRRCVASLRRDDDIRRLGLYWFDGDWCDYFRFLAVRK